MNPILFTRGVPPQESIPIEKLSICAREVISEHGVDVLQYAPSPGYLPLREYLSERKELTAERVLLGQGSLQILDMLIHCLLQPGDVVAVEQPTYDRVLTLMRRADLCIFPIDLRPDGLDLDQLETALVGGLKLRLMYVIADFQNPSGALMPLNQRQRLVSLSQQYRFQIVEDAPYRTLRYNGEDLPSIFDLSPATVIQLSSFSKLISPGLRVGYAVLPENLHSILSKYAEDTYINPSYLNQAIVLRFIQKGWFEGHITFLKDLYSHRLQMMLNALQSHLDRICTWTKPEGGFFVGLWLGNGHTLAEVWERSEAAGIRLTDGRGFFERGGESFIRLPFCALDEQDIHQGIQRLAALLDS